MPRGIGARWRSGRTRTRTGAAAEHQALQRACKKGDGTEEVSQARPRRHRPTGWNGGAGRTWGTDLPAAPAYAEFLWWKGRRARDAGPTPIAPSRWWRPHGTAEAGNRGKALPPLRQSTPRYRSAARAKRGGRLMIRRDHLLAVEHHGRESPLTDQNPCCWR